MPADRRLLRRATRAVLVALAAALATLGAALPAAASAATLPPQGTFEDCSLDTEMATCIQRLQVMHAGGLQIVALPVGDGSPANLAAYAATAQSLGMKVMWELANEGWWLGYSMPVEYPELADACGCTDNASLLTYTVHFLASLPGTYGYYAVDDSMLTAGATDAVSRYVGAVKTLDPAHPVIVSSANESQTTRYEGLGDMNAAEIYPVTTDSLMPASNNLAMWDAVAQTASDDQRLADQAGRPSAFILQAFTFGDNLSDGEAVGVCSPGDTPQQCYGELRYPTAGAQLELRNEVLEHAHPKLIMWWNFPGTYGQVQNDTLSIYPAGAAAATRWAGLEAAVRAPAPGSGSSSAGKRVSVAHTARVRRPARSRRHRARHHRSHHHRTRRHRHRRHAA